MDISDIDNQIAEKEREWKRMQSFRISALEKSISDLRNEQKEEREKFQILKNDFKYNLSLLRERDAELTEYDVKLKDIEAQHNAVSRELSEALIRCDDLEKQLKRESEYKSELQKSYLQRINEKHAELEKYKSAKDKEITAERKDIELFRRDLEQKVSCLEEEIIIQKRELTTEFDDQVKKREHEMQKEIDKAKSELLAEQLKTKVLGKEIELLGATKEQQCSELADAELSQQELNQLLHHKDWQLTNMDASNKSKVLELETTISNLKSSMKRLEETSIRKHKENELALQEKEALVSKLKVKAQDVESSYKISINDVQSKLEDMEIKCRQNEWSAKDCINDKNNTIDRLHEEISNLNEKLESQMTDLSRTNVARDLELSSLREDNLLLKNDLLQRKSDIDRYKRELSSALDQNNLLEQSKSQLDLDWQRRLETVERSQFDKSEELLKNLTTSKDQATAELKVKVHELQQHQDLIELLKSDRDQAFATLQQHGIVINQHIKLSGTEGLPETSADKLVELQRQNDDLRQVIHGMRGQMESLGTGIQPVTLLEAPPSQAYVKNLENDLNEVKSINRKLNAEKNEKEKKQCEDSAFHYDGDNQLIKSHIESLNNNIGSLRSEKMQLVAELRKHQSRVVTLQSMNEQLEKEPQKAVAELEQVRYEYNAAKRRHDVDVKNLQRQVTENDRQLKETRQEADEYHRQLVQLNADLTDRKNEVSRLKLDLAEKRHPINFGAQELVIQQLHEEIERMRKELSRNQDQTTPSISSTDQGSVVHKLTNKLKMAAKDIQQLAQEKQVLIEVGNRLRAELLRFQAQRPHSPPTRDLRGVDKELYSVDQTNIQNKLKSKLDDLEKMQYNLMKQKLAHDQNRDESSASSIEEENYRPTSILKKTSEAPSESPAFISDTNTLKPQHFQSDSNQGMPSNTSELARLSMSSFGAESLQDVWRILDERTPRSEVTTPQLDSHINAAGNKSAKHKNNSEIAVKGKKVQGESSSTTLINVGRGRAPSNLSDKAAGKLMKKQERPKIRNYNIRDKT